MPDKSHKTKSKKSQTPNRLARIKAEAGREEGKWEKEDRLNGYGDSLSESEGTMYSINPRQEYPGIDRSEASSDKSSMSEDEAGSENVVSNTHLLREYIEEIIQQAQRSRKRLMRPRADSMAGYISLVSDHIFADEIYGDIEELVPALLKDVKVDQSLRESVLALRAISLTILSFSDHPIYDGVEDQLKRTISSSQFLAVKAAAIHCLATHTTLCGADQETIQEVMSFLLEIISSDGSYVDAEDDRTVVIAALQEYGFLATYVDDQGIESDDAAAVFLDQLDSSEVTVQIAAGENIALLYEKSYASAVAADSTDESELDTVSDASSSERVERSHTSQSQIRKNYRVYHDQDGMRAKIGALASLSTHKMSLYDKKLLHQTFSRILNTVDNPQDGLQYNESGRMILRIQQTGYMKIDRWWKLMRLNNMRRALKGGFLNHYIEGNKQVLVTLPLALRRDKYNPKDQVKKKFEKRKTKSGKRVIKISDDEGFDEP